MSRPGLFARALGWLEDVAAGGKLDDIGERLEAAQEAQRSASPPAREEPADPARVAAWRSLIDVSVRLKREPGPLSMKDARWCGREIARCLRAIWTSEDRRGLSDLWAEDVGRRLRELLTEHDAERMREDMELPPSETKYSRLVIGVENTFYEAQNVGDGLITMRAATVEEWAHVCAFRAAVGCTFIGVPKRPTGTINGREVGFIELGQCEPDVAAGLASFVLRWVDWKEDDAAGGAAKPEAAEHGVDCNGNILELGGPFDCPGGGSDCPGAVSERQAREEDARFETRSLRAKEAADHAAWLRENAVSVVLPEHPAVALLREIQWDGWIFADGGEVAERACPVCLANAWNLGDKGTHAPGCALAAVLAGSKPSERALAEEREAGRREGLAMRDESAQNLVDNLRKTHAREVDEARELGRREQREQHARNLRALEAESQQVLGARLAEERAKGAAEERARWEARDAITRSNVYDNGHREGAAGEREAVRLLLLALREDWLVRHIDAREVLRQAAEKVAARGQP